MADSQSPSPGYGILSQSIQGLFGLAAAGFNYWAQRKLAEQQNQFNIDMWKMQADYNSPQAQMKRFEEAGLNPNLIYGQGSSGNMSSAPEMVTPNAPDVSKSMQRLAEAFNIEHLRTIAANRKKAQEDARIAELNRFDLEDERDFWHRFQRLYSYDINTGRYVPNLSGIEVTGSNPRGSRTGNGYLGEAYLMRFLGSHDPRMWNMSLQRNLLTPQIVMSNYDARYYPWSYWIDRGTKGVHGIVDAASLFNPSRYYMPLRGARKYMSPTGRVFNY